MSTAPAGKARVAPADGFLFLAFEPLPLGAVRPAGWLRRQLEIQAAGFHGHLEEHWPTIANSDWVGRGGEGWEDGPYWLDSVTPLAFLTDDARLKGQVVHWMDYILTHQDAEGWLGPKKGPPGSTHKPPLLEPWARIPLLKAMLQYAEASGDRRVFPAMTRYLRCLRAHINDKEVPPGWRYRWEDMQWSIQRLYDRTGESDLPDIARVMLAESFNWRDYLANLMIRERMVMRDWPHFFALMDISQGSHVVHNAMAVKDPAVSYRTSGDPAHREAVYQVLETLDHYHGRVTGILSGDEHYAGLNPSQGTETCAVVEYMFSMEVLMAILGDPAFGDRLEKIAFNALPAPFTPDMWALQYDQQTNQALCRFSEDNLWVFNGPQSGTFRFLPMHHRCCVVNSGQGWPKFAAHLWMRSRPELGAPHGGLAAVAWAPCCVQTRIGRAAVRIDVETEYPFGEEVAVRVHTARAVRFPLYLRIPGWARTARVRVGPEPARDAVPGTFHRIERRWEGETEILVELPMRVRTERRYNDSVAILRGPLVYSLKIGERWEKVEDKPPYRARDLYPTTPWNYALEIDPSRPAPSIYFRRKALGDYPFSPEGAPVEAAICGRRLPGWDLEHNAAAPPPRSPVLSEEPPEILTLIPYGCTSLRMTEFPVMELRR